jgi:hypothetical protein
MVPPALAPQLPPPRVAARHVQRAKECWRSRAPSVSADPNPRARVGAYRQRQHCPRRHGRRGEGRLPRADLLGRALAAYQRSRAPMRFGRSFSPSSTTLCRRRTVGFGSWTRPGRCVCSSTSSSPTGAAPRPATTPTAPSSSGTRRRACARASALFLTGATYTGKHGHSLELIGLDPGINDNAFARAASSCTRRIT